MEKRGKRFEGICEIINVILVNHASIVVYVLCRLANHQSILF